MLPFIALCASRSQPARWRPDVRHVRDGAGQTAMRDGTDETPLSRHFAGIVDMVVPVRITAGISQAGTPKPS